MKYLTVEEVVKIHAVAIELKGGSPGVLDAGLVESAVQHVRQTVGGTLLYASVEEVAAAYWHSLTTNHGFRDGNKRTAVIAAAAFLAKNGYALDMDDDEIIEIGLAMAGQGMSRQEVFEKVRQHVVKIDCESG